MKRRTVLLVMVLAGAPASASLAAEPAAKADPPASDVDMDLLEFLGSLDAEDGEWREYLEQRPIRAEAGKQEVARKQSATVKQTDKQVAREK